MAMREMKDSGIPWIGKIPKRWEIIKGKYILTYLQRPILSTDKVITCFRDGEVTLRSNRREEGFTISEKEIGYQGIDVGDLVVHGMDGFAGSIGISDSRGKASPVLNVLNSSQDKKFLMYYLRSMAYNNVFLALSMGIRVRSCDLNWNKLANLPYAIPPIQVQHRIADFLDAKCAKIDSIKKNVESEIEALKQYKQSVITEAVTKGLDKNVEMKDSEIPWVGKIPKGWKIGKIKYITDYSLNYPIGDGDHGLIKSSEYQMEGIPYIRVLNLTWGFGLDLKNIVYISEKQNRSIQGSQLKPGDILIAKTGATIGKTAIVPATLPISNTTSHVGKISVSKEHCAMYFYYQMNSSIVQKQVYDISSMQSTRPELGIEGLKNLVIVIPPKLEQEKISAYIQDKVTRINLIIKQKKGALTNLDSYKKSLIYEYVTGKKEVPAV